MSSRFAVLLFLLLSCGVLVACDDDDPVEIEPPQLDPQITDTFMGTLEQLGTSVHLFTVAGRNETEMTITELMPLETLTIGIGIGTSADGGETCSLLAQDRSVRRGETFLVSSVDPGEYCIALFDVGNIFPDQVVNYTVEVLHP